MQIVVRFAPSPTGHIHLGNARIALLNWLFARKVGGQFMLRLDDTDKERSKQEYIDGLSQDLSWLGMDYDVFARQSDRAARYTECKQKLIDAGYLYPCYETFEELEQKRRIQLAKKQPPIYDRAALTCKSEDIATWEREGRSPHWRFKLRDEETAFDDMIKGHLSFNPSLSLSDPVLIKEDGTFLYTISSVIDDIDFGITHIIRGEDHVTNTAIQVQLFQALHKCLDLDMPLPIFAHLALLLDQDGQPLSKRLNSYCLKHLRSEGIEPMALNCFLASMGSSSPLYITDNLRDLAAHFDLDHVRGGARIDDKALLGIQHKILHTMPFDELVRRGQDARILENEWNLVRESLDRVEDVEYWKSVLHGKIELPDLSDEDVEFVRGSATWLIEQADIVMRLGETSAHVHLGGNMWDFWFDFLRQTSGRKGFDLVHPIRMRLTGRANGPEMKRLLPLIDLDTILERLTA
ncbi:MAG: glutamate--tRNA ligase [Holosporales bacterium]|jgi:glutamyl-tRNA synthetase|nr:glutamate--tRNA ligase [Holosporales bacterium]